MSLLANTSYANPTTPFWASAGSGGGGGDSVRFIDGTTTPISYTVSSTSEETITYVAVPDPGKSGKYVVNASFNCWGAGYNNHFGCKIIEGASGIYTNTELDTSDLPLSWVSGSINFTFPYAVGDDVPSFYFNVDVVVTDGDPQVILTYTIMFYPDP